MTESPLNPINPITACPTHYPIPMMMIRVIVIFAVALLTYGDTQQAYYDGYDTMLTLVNKARAERKLPPLCVCPYPEITLTNHR